VRHPYLSVIVPCYNEQARIAKTLDALFMYLPHHVPSFEIIAVDDGSTDRTWEVLSVYQRVYAHYIPIRVEHSGKGNAVRVGMLTAFGDHRIFMDADLSTPLTEIPAALEWLRTYDIAIGSREIDRSKVKATLKRRIMGRIFNTLIADLTPGVRDTQCGFKGFRADVAEQLFNQQMVKGWAFDVELLYLARVLGYRVKEFPVAWKHCEGSKVRAVSASFEMIRDVLDIPMMHSEINFLEGRRI
jgi:dolichyl-phosphate beta-glucosyltransferase